MAQRNREKEKIDILGLPKETIAAVVIAQMYQVRVIADEHPDARARELLHTAANLVLKLLEATPRPRSSRPSRKFRPSSLRRGTDMQSYLFIGGKRDNLNVPVPPDLESVQLPAGVTGKETYIRETLAVGDVFITIYRHESLTSVQVLNRLVEHYKAWAVNRPGGRL